MDRLVIVLVTLGAGFPDGWLRHERLVGLREARERDLRRLLHQGVHAAAAARSKAAQGEKQQALLEGELSGLRALQPPVMQRDRYTGYVADLAELDSQYSLIIGDLKSGPPSNLRLSVAERLGRRLSDLQATVERDARDLRLAECAEDPYSATHYAIN